MLLLPEVAETVSVSSDWFCPPHLRGWKPVLSLTSSPQAAQDAHLLSSPERTETNAGSLGAIHL